MKFVCPVCNSTLHHKRIDDAVTIHAISPDGSFDELSSESDGSDSIYCSQDSSHKLPRELYDAALDLSLNQ